MKLLRRMAVLALVVLVLGGCTKSSSTSAGTNAGEEEIDPDKLAEGDDDVIYPREENLLVEDETEAKSMYDWDQVRDQATELFTDKNSFPQSSAFDFTADEANLSIELDWTLKADTSDEDVMEYAVILVKQFNDMVAVQATDVDASDDNSFGGLWKTFSLKLNITAENGNSLLKKEYKAGDTIDLVMPEYTEAGPEDVAEDVPKKD